MINLLERLKRARSTFSTLVVGPTFGWFFVGLSRTFSRQSTFFFIYMRITVLTVSSLAQLQMTIRTLKYQIYLQLCRQLIFKIKFLLKIFENNRKMRLAKCHVLRTFSGNVLVRKFFQKYRQNATDEKPHFMRDFCVTLTRYQFYSLELF